MTISTQTSSVTAAGDGANKDFAYTFLIPYQADGTTVAVVVETIASTGVATTQTITTDFTITGVGVAAGGTVHYPVSGSALAVGTYIRISRALDLVQETALEDQGFRASQVETVADTTTMQVQDVYTRAVEAWLPPCTYASLPSAVKNLGLRGTVTDGAVALTFGTAVTVGGGSTVLPVVSIGSGWIVG